MKNRFLSHSAVAAAVACVLSLLLLFMPAAQAQAPAAAAPTPRLSNGHPDLTGYWAGFQPKFFTAQKENGDIPGVDYLKRTADGSLFYDYGGSENPGDQLRDIAAPLAPPTNQASYKPEY